jgi:hypothetical protein
MKKTPHPLQQIGVAHPACLALVFVLGIAACAALLLTPGATTEPPPHHHAIFAELQRIAVQLERSEHRHREGIDSVGQRLVELQRVLGVLAEAVTEGGGKEAVEVDMKLKRSVEVEEEIGADDADTVE